MGALSHRAPPAPDVDALVARAAAGDQQAFAALYRAHAQEVFTLLTRLVGPRAEREDLLQEVFVRFHRALPGYRREAALATFLHRIAVRVALDHLRACGRRPRLAEPVGADDGLADVGERVATGEPSAEQRLAQRDELAAVMTFLDGLAPAQRIAFVLREVMGLSYPEIGELQGCFATTARMRVAAASRALARLVAPGRRPA